MSLDVNGFLANSRVLSHRLNRLAPTAVVHLAADPEVIQPVQQYNVVYHGQKAGTD
jgi:hypothetical protein